MHALLQVAGEGCVLLWQQAAEGGVAQGCEETNDEDGDGIDQSE